jgi:hypothetical protein
MERDAQRARYGLTELRLTVSCIGSSSQRPAARRISVLANGGEHHNPGSREVGIPADALGQLEPIDLRHLGVVRFAGERGLGRIALAASPSL